jgi:hypothetical protein
VPAAARADDGTAQEVAEEQQGGLLHTGVRHHLPLRTRHHNVDPCIRFNPANSSVIKTPDCHKIRLEGNRSLIKEGIRCNVCVVNVGSRTNLWIICVSNRRKLRENVNSKKSITESWIQRLQIFKN